VRLTVRPPLNVKVNTSQLVTQSTRHMVNSSQSARHSQLVTVLNYADGQLVTRATSCNSLGDTLSITTPQHLSRVSYVISHSVCVHVICRLEVDIKHDTRS